jgi:hypothetical protein
MSARLKLLICLLIGFSNFSIGQTQNDTIYAFKSLVPVVVDGTANDECWSTAVWRPINQVWIPYGASMSSADFTGRYKVSWDSLYLYVLVEVVDDVLSDDHAVATQNWWDDDCVEVFLDENRSKGNHEKNNNAFAYHVSLFYDAIDLDAQGNGVNYKQNIKVVMDTLENHTYLWEMAIKNYSATFNLSNPEASRVKLVPNKLMGFTIAYCDNDLTTSRENFIGSIYMTAATANNNYITADYFGTLLLVDQEENGSSIATKTNSDSFVKVYPNPAKDKIFIEKKNTSNREISLEIRSLTGSLVKSLKYKSENTEINIADLSSGIYILNIASDNCLQTEKLVVF